MVSEYYSRIDTYEPLDRLTKGDYHSGYGIDTEEFIYDDLGNRLTLKVDDVIDSQYTHSQGNGDDDSSASSSASSRWSVKWKARDLNKDTLTYEVYLRLVGRERWIRIAKDLSKGVLKWESLTVADGRYEIKVQASDRKSNPEAQALTHSRVSAVFVVDNSGPEVLELSYDLAGQAVAVASVVEDALSVIRSVAYSLNSAKDWEVLAALDGVYDSRHEAVAFEVDVEEAGEHVIAIRYTDAAGNRSYRNIVVNVK